MRRGGADRSGDSIDRPAPSGNNQRALAATNARTIGS